MNKIVECVPNFSEGRDMSVIDKIADVIKATEDVVLLDIDPGKDTNRTVVTFAGSPEGVAEAAFAAIKKAGELIDMSKHKGAHARMGATDVCPFIPVSGVTMEECVEISKKVGKRVGEELGIPVYLYAESAVKSSRKRLPDIREGEYEALPDKLKKNEFAPDFGKPEFNKKSGATAVGARGFLIAYNINLNTKNTKIANKIAKRLREKGRNIKNKETGKKENIPGMFKGVQGMGWFIEEYEMAQVTVNILNYKESPLYRIFDEAEKLALEFGARVTGSEIVGLIPLDALKEAGVHYLRRQGSSTGVSEKEIIRVAVQSMGLNEVSDFNINERIIEYRFKKSGKLVSMKVNDFMDELASDSPAPGGGSVAAINGSLSVALSAMVGNLTVNKIKYKNVREDMIKISEEGQELKEFFIDAIDKDTDAFNKIMDAFTLPKKSEAEQKIRDEAIQAATIEATLIPFSVLENAKKAVDLAYIAVKKGNTNSLSDAGVAALTAVSSAAGAFYNVKINLTDIKDADLKTKLSSKSRKILDDVYKKGNEISKLVEKTLEGE
ncbi:MAG: glutamate formimidoyltransferase [Acidobacteriota bacterium]